MKIFIRLTMLVSLIAIGLPGAAEVLQSRVPLSVDAVTTTRVNNHLVRTIIYATSSAQLDIELIKAPEMDALLDRRTIDRIYITVSGQQKLLDFANAAAVSISATRVEDGVVKFNVEYFVKSGGGYYFSACEVDAKKENLSELTCHLQRQGLSQSAR